MVREELRRQREGKTALPHHASTHSVVCHHPVHKGHPLGQWDLHPALGPLCGWEQLARSGPTQLPLLLPSLLTPPTLPLIRGITPICSMAFRGACSGISWKRGGVESGQQGAVGLL